MSLGFKHMDSDSLFCSAAVWPFFDLAGVGARVGVNPLFVTTGSGGGANCWFRA